MSELSEALERQLHKLMHPQKAAAPAPPKGASIDDRVVKSIHLAYHDGTSDKVYNVQLVESSGGWEVNFQYGRRGKTLIEGTKTNGHSVALHLARQIYNELVDSKKDKGYKEI